MSLQAYYDNIKAKTGKTPQDFKNLAEKKGLLQDGVKPEQVVQWLKQDYGLGRGRAMSIVLFLKSTTQPRVSKDERVDKLFRGDKAKWRKPYDELLAKVSKFGPDVSVAPTESYISILRQGKKFAITQASSERLDIGIKLKRAQATDRFEPAGTWNGMVTHRVRIGDPKQIDGEILAWLKQAYEEALPLRSRASAG